MTNVTEARRGKLYTYSGCISFPGDAPTLLDMAVSLSREGRYAGNGMRWWPVVLHTFIVCDLLPNALKLDGLLHDGPECITGDAPKPTKTNAFELFEEELLVSIYASFNLKFPTAAARALVHKADRDVMCGEVYTVGTHALQSEYPRCPKAEKLVMKYLAEYPPMECISPDGRAPMEFMRRFRIYSDMRKAK